MNKTMRQEVADMHFAITKTKMAEKLASLGQSPISVSLQAGEEIRCDPDCDFCGGSGYARYDVPVGHPKFGKLEPCPKYRTRELRQMNLSQFGMEASEINLDWSCVKKQIGYLRMEAIRAVDAVKPKLEQGHGMVSLLGTYGQGKTLVGKILIAQALKIGKSAAYANMSRILDDIRLAFDEKENMNRELARRMDYWMTLDVLFIDELDRVNGTEWALDRMFQLLDQRYAKAVREQALTVVASNKATDELDGYLVSRLKDHRLGPVVYLNGDDAREVMPDGWRH